MSASCIVHGEELASSNDCLLTMKTMGQSISCIAGVIHISVHHLMIIPHDWSALCRIDAADELA